MFRAPAMLLPHESTVAHEQRFIMDEPMISRSRLRQEPTIDESAVNDEILQITKEDLAKLQVIELALFESRVKSLKKIIFQLNDKGDKPSAGLNSVPHTRPVTPRSVTHNHDEDYSDEESDPNAKSDEDRFNHSSSDEKWNNQFYEYLNSMYKDNSFCRRCWSIYNRKTKDSYNSVKALNSQPIVA